MDSAPPSKPKRRPRYKGTHPRKFEEKYKELAPERYRDDVEKIKARGSTPAGTHRPICVSEILESLNPRPGETGLDATLGYGGHARELLNRIRPGGRLVALDQDPLERPKTEARLREAGFGAEELIVGPINFSRAWEFLRGQGVGPVDFVLADLGLSSMQIDDPGRGFTFKHEGPLDLRMNPKAGVPAAEWLAKIDEKELTQLLADNADEPHARQIAAALVRDRPKTTTQLADSIRGVLKTFSKNVREREGDTPIRRALQAIRIAINDEFGALDAFLSDLPHMLKPGGRAAILTFHSGEDRRVKKAFQAGERSGLYARVAPEPIRPSFEEQRANPRSKPAKLRWAIRSGRAAQEPDG
ncbi:MAG TPA: 16S rRNA (cytosine(1402)-N(4))-methyltransferase RsmH [Bdellovibrionales bacterium]|nr:16S rRNA (cytosine(1402)-N(4))-methyltransferase RsmH [Bdellovibrionales bacterium]